MALMRAMVHRMRRRSWIRPCASCKLRERRIRIVMTLMRVIRVLHRLRQRKLLLDLVKVGLSLHVGQQLALVGQDPLHEHDQMRHSS